MIRKAAIAAAITLASATTFAEVESIQLEDTFSLPVKFHATEHMLFARTSDFIDPAQPMANTLMNEGRVRAELNRYSLGVHFANRFTPDGTTGVNRPFVLEKASLSYEDRNWTVILGDSHQELGRGIALSLYRDETFGLANTSQGATAKFISNKGEVDANVFAGRLRSLQAPVALLPWENPLVNREVWMASASTKARVVDDSFVGGHYLLTVARPLESQAFNQRWHTVGASVSAESIGDSVDFYGETNVLKSQDVASGADTRPVGYGTFASVTYSALPWRVQVEAKDYRGYYFDFQRPPSLEEDVVTSINNQDMSIARLNVFHGDTKVSFLVGDDRVAKTSMRHGVAQTIIKGPGKTVWVARTGYRWLTGQADLIHANIAVKIPTWTGQTLELGVRKLWSHTNLHFLPTEEDRNFWDVTYSFSDSWNFGVGYEYVPTQWEPHYVNANTKVAFSSSLQARASVGKTSGGPQCSGGICRTVPAYSGALLDVSYAF